MSAADSSELLPPKAGRPAVSAYSCHVARGTRLMPPSAATDLKCIPELYDVYLEAVKNYNKRVKVAQDMKTARRIKVESHSPRRRRGGNRTTAEAVATYTAEIVDSHPPPLHGEYEAPIVGIVAV